MNAQFYVAPEQQMKDRADFARKGIARGRAVIVLRYADGICFVAENPSTTLHKVSEIYDRIGFAAVGRYNEFESLRVAGIQAADVRGYTYDRADVTARSLVNSYASVLGTAFASADKPFEVELAVAEVGQKPGEDRIYRVSYDGSVFDEGDFAAMGASAELVADALSSQFSARASFDEAVRAAAKALRTAAGGARGALEVAALDRTRAQRRKFVRVAAERLEALLS